MYELTCVLHTNDLLTDKCVLNSYFRILVIVVCRTFIYPKKNLLKGQMRIIESEQIGYHDDGFTFVCLHSINTSKKRKQKYNLCKLTNKTIELAIS